VTVKNKKELDILREGGRRLAVILVEVSKAAKVGTETKDLDALAEELILKVGGNPSFRGYQVQGAPMPYPGSLCVSINEEVVHGLPSNRALKAGDIIGLDIGMRFEGLFTDTAMTILIGNSDLAAKLPSGGLAIRTVVKLINATKKSLEIGIAKVKNGVKTGAVGYAIQDFLQSCGYGVVRELVGHGVGRAVHEDPEIPNWGRLGTGSTLKEGMVIALEPMATLGDYRVELAPDGWTWVTKDKSLSAHFEHTIVVTKTGAEILTQI